MALVSCDTVTKNKCGKDIFNTLISIFQSLTDTEPRNYITWEYSYNSFNFVFTESSSDQSQKNTTLHKN